MTRRLSRFPAASLLLSVALAASWAFAPAATQARTVHIGAWSGSIGCDAGGVVP